MSTVAVIGLGNMGARMAANAVKAGHRVRGYDIVAECRIAAERLGVEASDRLEDVVDEADIYITMLHVGESVVDVWRRLAPKVGAGVLAIDCSTIDVASSRKAHGIAAEYGLLSLDAPVSGGVEGAAAASLTFMVGGEPQAFEAGSPFLRQLGRKVIYCGAAGAGEAAKICNNMILGINMIAVCEAFNLGEALGLSREALFQVASSASGQCYALTTHCPVPGPVPTSASNFGYKPGFAAELMAKDLRLSQDCAKAASTSTPLGSMASSLYLRFIADCGAGVDYSGIIEFLKSGRV